MVRVKADDIAVYKRKKRFKRDSEQLSISKRIAELEKRIERLEKEIQKLYGTQKR